MNSSPFQAQDFLHGCLSFMGSIRIGKYSQSVGGNWGIEMSWIQIPGPQTTKNHQKSWWLEEFNKDPNIYTVDIYIYSICIFIAFLYPKKIELIALSWVVSARCVFCFFDSLIIQKQKGENSSTSIQLQKKLAPEIRVTLEKGCQIDGSWGAIKHPCRVYFGWRVLL